MQRRLGRGIVSWEQYFSFKAVFQNSRKRDWFSYRKRYVTGGVPALGVIKRA